MRGERADPERPVTIVAGDAVDGVHVLWQAAAGHGRMFAVSAAVYAACGSAPDAALTIPVAWPGGCVIAHLVPRPAAPPPHPGRREIRRLQAAVQRIWGG